jgi:arsenate reductase
MAPTIYHNPRCSKSRETLALLEKRGHKPRVVEYLKTPPSTMELKNIARMLGLSVRDLVRKSEAVDAGIDPVEMDEKDLVAAMVRNPSVIERPIVVNIGKAAIGRPPENVLKIL